MLKFVYSGVLLQEVPNEISIGFTLLGCPRHCPNCHSQAYWDTNVPANLGEEFSANKLDEILLNRAMVELCNCTCLCFFGGDWSLDDFMGTIDRVKTNILNTNSKLYNKYKLAWYTGKTLTKEEIDYYMNFFDYIKIGEYNEKLGGLNNKTTNQIMYMKDVKNITSLFWS